MLGATTVRRVGWRRTARLKEPQAYNPIHHLKLSVSACRPSPRGAPRLGDKAGGSASRTSTASIHRLIILRSSFSAAASGERNIKAEAASKRRCASPPHPGAAGRPLTRGLSYSLSALK